MKLPETFKGDKGVIAFVIKLAVCAGRSFWPRYIFSRYQWYRRWFGGRWEYHWITVTSSAMWLEMEPGKCWPEYRQPCSMGTPIIEDYPVKTTPSKQ